MKIFKRVLIGLVIVLGLGAIGGYFYWQQSVYEPSTQAEQSFKQGIDKEDYLLFESQKSAKHPMVIFYPGALVEPESYSIWAEQLAENGYTVAIAKMPFELAILSGNKADKIREDFKDQDFVIGGHSLGGVMASRYANANLDDERLKGIYFMASYPDEKGTLAKTDLPVISITGSEDEVMNQEAADEAKAYLPEQTEFVSIAGGNHGGFGSYGHQKGDGEAAISNEDQQTAIVTTMMNWLNQIK